MTDKIREKKDKQEVQYISASKDEVKKILIKSNKKNKKVLSILAKS